MGYYLYDSKGFVGDLGSAGTLKKFDAWVQGNGGPWLKGLLAEGTALVFDDFRTELQAMGLPESPAYLRAFAENIFDLIPKCDVIAIISEGLEEEVE